MTEPTLRIAITGLGRIGRCVLRQILQGQRHGAPRIEVVQLSDIAPVETCAYLFQFDSVFGVWPGTVASHADALIVDGQAIRFDCNPDVSTLDLRGVDVLLECTGKAVTPDVARRGLDAGARAVLISGPSDAAETTAVIGANEGVLENGARIVSAASCTTHALAPLLHLLDKRFGLLRGHMTTIHCYTGSQPTVDAPRGGDLIRSRAAALSMVPTTTSATRMLDRVLPELTGRLSGAAVRVPVASVSAVDLTVQLDAMPAGDMRAPLREMIKSAPVLGMTEHPNVSSDLRGRAESLILALPETMRSGARQLRLLGWYDNEWGFSARMLDTARLIAAR